MITWSYWSNPIELANDPFVKLWNKISSELRINRYRLGLNRVFPGHVNSLGELDARLRIYENELKPGGDDIFVTQAQIYFSELWMLHIYEILRVLRNLNLKPKPPWQSEIALLVNKAAEARIRLAKQALPKDKEETVLPGLAYPARTLDGKYGWELENGNYFYRSQFADEVISVFNKIKEDHS